MNRDVERSTKACGQIDEVEFSALETSVTLLCPLGYQKNNMRTVIFYKISKWNLRRNKRRMQNKKNLNSLSSPKTYTAALLRISSEAL